MPPIREQHPKVRGGNFTVERHDSRSFNANQAQVGRKRIGAECGAISACQRRAAIIVTSRLNSESPVVGHPVRQSAARQV